MENAINRWLDLEGCDNRKPSWVTGDTKTVRFSNTVARELAKLIMMEVDVKVDSVYGRSDKARMMQSVIDESLLSILQDNIERTIRLGGLMCKWNGEGLEFVPPGRFAVTSFNSAKDIDGCIFFSYKNEGNIYFTKAEYHRFEQASRKNEQTEQMETVNIYKVSNKVFKSDKPDEIGDQISIDKSPWKGIEPEFQLEGLERPLFAYLKNPHSNTIDSDSPLGVSLFSECEEELRWLDVAMSTLGTEVEDSKPVLFVDESALTFARNQGIELPRFVKGMSMGISAETTLEQWQPQLQIASRKEGINFYLNIISMKVGMDSGTFVFDGQSITMATATQVEASERKTVNTVASFRSILDRPIKNGDGRIGFIHDVAYIIDVILTLNGDSEPSDFGNYQLFCNFADITRSEEEDKAFDYQLMNNGLMAKWRFLVLHCGLTEEEAKQRIQEAREEKAMDMEPDESLFAEEE